MKADDEQASNSDSDRLTEAVNLLLKRLDRLPGPLREKVHESAEQLRDFLAERRIPRVMLLGRRGSGKSALINAIFDAPVRKIGSVLRETPRTEWELWKCNVITNPFE